MVPVIVVIAISWLTARALVEDQVNSRITNQLTSEVTELRLLADSDVDPQSGQPFADTGSLLRLFLERNIPDQNETMFAIVNGSVDSRSQDVPPTRLDTNEALINKVRDVDEVTYGQIDTVAGLVKYVAAPVVAATSDDRGVLVVGVFAERENDQIDRIVRTLGLVSLGALGLATLVGWFVAGRVLAPLRDMAETAHAISDSDLTKRIPRSSDGRGDEIDELAGTFNDMLDRLESAFASQRSFIDDAGHELRTPITIIRGHLEVMPEDPIERGRTVDLVLDELGRMSRIVEDLITLTKAQQPDFIRTAPLDLGEITDEIVVKASGLADRSWRLDERAEGIINGDRQRLAQAILQLADNASRHTNAGAEIGIGSAILDGHVRLWVRDTGTGVAPEDRERIFTRFVRGNSAHSTEGAGLGLSIVSAIAQAHGGRIELSETIGGGSTFTLVFPLQSKEA
jgi:signal transduction histidine kinase